MSKVIPTPETEELGGFSVPSEGEHIAALLEPVEMGLSEEDQQKREGMSDTELRNIRVDAILLSASISRGDDTGGRASLYCGLTKPQGQKNFLRFIAGTGLASTLEQKYPDLGPIEQGWEESIITSRRFFNELKSLFPGHEVSITIKHRTGDRGTFANIVKVAPLTGNPGETPLPADGDASW
jgi:hypothetical protein